METKAMMIDAYNIMYNISNDMKVLANTTYKLIKKQKRLNMRVGLLTLLCTGVAVFCETERRKQQKQIEELSAEIEGLKRQRN